MGPASHRKRSKRLLKLLRELQQDDYPITAPTLLAAKHLLQQYNPCTVVEVKIDSEAAGLPFETHRRFLPNFVVSQLEEQKLTDKHSENVLVSPIVFFILLSLPILPGLYRTYPTLFRWYCPPRHKTYYIFAHLTRDMTRRTYTLTELLSLRGNPATKGISALTGNPEFADIARRSGSESSSSASGCKPVAGRHKDDSSVTSDELLFKGTVSRRMGREISREPSRNPIRPPTRESVPEPLREAPLDPSQPMEWKYRGRSDAEVISMEPIPAPSSRAAQQSEGFQRFYKAVVSPTHVRVTAGGRIVPNTRGPPSPTSKRASDSPSIENQNIPDGALPKPSPNPAGFTQPIPVVSQLIPGYPPGFQPIQAPVSFVPMTFGAHLPPGISFAQPALSSPAVTQLAAENTLKDMHNMKPSETRNEGYAVDDKQGKVKISPPELFDCTKPYYYNGQIIYPVGAFSAPLGNQMVPVHMVGVPPGVPQVTPSIAPGMAHGATPQLPGHFMQSHPKAASSSVMGTPYTPSSIGVSAIPPAANHIVPANANFTVATAPPPSSIKLSDITRKQIASFKQSLRYHEDQLQYNRHQIDEKDMETRIQTIKGHIQRFETTLKSQLEYEEAQRKASENSEGKAPSQSAATSEGTRASSQPAPSPERGMHPPINEADEAIRRRVALASYGLNTNIGEGGKAVFRCPPEPSFQPMNDQAKGPALPSEAALAPVFQPRYYSSSWEAIQHAKELEAKSEAGKSFLGVVPGNPNQGSMGEQRAMSHSFAAPYMAVLPQAEGSFGASSSTSRPGSNGSISSKHGRPQSNFGVPYLLGTLPKGVNPRTARDQDYVYKRPLTEEERRARFLYWGKAPKSAVRGLPKFDGKHFYPPSPVKEPTAVPDREIATDSLSNGHLEIDHRQTESDCDPFRPMTPIERVHPKTVTASEDNCTVGRRTRNISFETQVDSGSEDFQTPGGAPLKYREASVDASSIGSADRRSEKSGAKLWQTVLKKGPTSSALSATTAQGLLPHYAGHAAASLSPSLNTNQSPSVKDISPGKSSDGGGALATATPEKVGENCPPNSVSSLQSQLGNLSLDVSGRQSLTPTFSI